MTKLILAVIAVAFLCLIDNAVASQEQIVTQANASRRFAGAARDENFGSPAIQASRHTLAGEKASLSLTTLVWLEKHAWSYSTSLSNFTKSAFKKHHLGQCGRTMVDGTRGSPTSLKKWMIPGVHRFQAQLQVQLTISRDGTINVEPLAFTPQLDRKHEFVTTQESGTLAEDFTNQVKEAAHQLSQSGTIKFPKNSTAAKVSLKANFIHDDDLVTWSRICVSTVKCQMTNQVYGQHAFAQYSIPDTCMRHRTSCGSACRRQLGISS